jgi:hypothetical protein
MSFVRSSKGDFTTFDVPGADITVGEGIGRTMLESCTAWRRIQKSLMISLRDIPSMSFNFRKPRLCSAPGSQANVSIAEWPLKQSLASLSQGKNGGDALPLSADERDFVGTSSTGTQYPLRLGTSR